MPDARDQALEGARRMYDRQLQELDNIDDKAMRTVRTSVLILGFVAAALTSVGLDGLEGLSEHSAVLAGTGVFLLLLAALGGIGIYTLSEYRFEMQRQDLLAASRIRNELWVDGAIGNLDKAIAEAEREIEKNAEYLASIQIFLITGTTALSLGVTVAVVKRTHGIEPEYQLIIWFGLLALLATVAKAKDLWPARVAQ